MSVEMNVKGAENRRHLRTHGLSTRMLLIPPNQEITLVVRSQGYKSWPADGSGASLLDLREGESRNLDIALEPEL